MAAAPRAGARRVARLALFVSGAALLALAASGPAHQMGWIDWRTAIGLLRFVAYGAVGGLALAVLAGIAGAGWRVPLAAIAAALLALSVPLGMMRRAQAVPAIHDITTDTDDPPRLSTTVRRDGAVNPLEHPGAAVAAQQKGAYPDVQPLSLPLVPAEAFERALAAAREMGWEVVAADPAQGRIEAVAATRFFGFKDDVVVRVRAEGSGSRVDVRSKSRVGRSDLGANAARIREFLARLEAT